MRATAKGEGTMRRAEADAVINDLPSEAYDFDERGATSLINENTDPGKLEAMAMMLNNDPRQLLRQVFRPSQALLRAVNATAATLLAVIKQKIGGQVAAVAQTIITALQAVIAWALHP
jgi:hypothetical protein